MAEKSEKQYQTFPNHASNQNLHNGPDEPRQTVTPGQKNALLFLIFVNAVVLIAVFVFNGLAASGPNSVFESTVSNQSDKYRLDITPAGWTFSIWGVIYTWQALWVLYSIIRVFRTTSQGPAYVSPVLLTPAFFVLYMLSNVFNVAWLLLFDRSHIQAAFGVLQAQPLCLVAALALSYRALDRCRSRCCCRDVGYIRGFVHNGLGIYATWTNIAALLNLAMVITYSKGSDVSVSTASTVALGVLTAEIVVFVGTDLLLLDRYSRWTLTPYAVVVFALSGSLAKNYEAGATNTVFTIVLLALGSLFLVVKIVVTIYRYKTDKSCAPEVMSTLDKSP